MKVNKVGGFMISEIIPEIIDENKQILQSQNVYPNRGHERDTCPDPKRVKLEPEDDDEDEDYIEEDEEDDEIEKGQVIKVHLQQEDESHETEEENKVFYECMSSASDSLHSSPRASSSPKAADKANIQQNHLKNIGYYSYMQQLLSALHHQNLFSGQNSAMAHTMPSFTSPWAGQESLMNNNHDSSLVSSNVTNNSSSPASSTSSLSTSSSLSAHKCKVSKKLEVETNLELNGPGMARYQCDACSKSYSTFGGLSKHKQFHCSAQIQKQFTCKYCDKTYTSLGALKMHIRTHTLPCKCKICGKCFSRPWLLQGHVRTHTGEKPFKCEVCARAFADRSNLRAHMQTHSDVKKYKCDKCAKTFSRMSLLNKHTLNCINNNNGSSSSSSITNKVTNRGKNDLHIMPQQFYPPNSNQNNLANAVAQYNKYLAVFGQHAIHSASNNFNLNEPNCVFKSDNVFKMYDSNKNV